MKRASREKRLNTFHRKRIVTFNAKYPSGTEENYAKFGKGFVNWFKPREYKEGGKSFAMYSKTSAYEATYEIILIAKEKTVQRHTKQIQAWDRHLAHLRIGFEKNSLIIEAMQTEINVNNYLNSFRRATKEKPLDKMLKEAEQTARLVGFKQVKIRKPQTLFYYMNPANTRLSDKSIQRNMRILYGRIAKANGYKEEEFYYTKTL
jgi:hypothetical protein